MDVQKILTELKRSSIHISVEEGNVKLAFSDGVTVSSDMIKQLKKNKNGIVDLLSRKPYKNTPPVVPVIRDKNIPLSFDQQRLWFVNQFEKKGDTSYNLPWALRLSGQLNVAALQQTLQSIVNRHEILRTTFLTTDEGQVTQAIADKSSLVLPVIDVTSAQVSIYTHNNIGHVFNLAKGPLITVKLLRQAVEEHILLINMHHIISDGWSSRVLFREMTAFYCAYATGESPSLQPLPIQYADFAIWQHNWLQGDMSEQHIAYWSKQLAGVAGLLTLPIDRPRSSTQTTHGDVEPFRIFGVLSDQIIALAREQRVTLFMLLMASLQILLSRYSGQADICVGTTSANRKQPELANLIGFFANKLVIRTQIDNQRTFKELLQQVKKTSLEAFQHQDLPFEQVIKLINPERSTSYSPLFQVNFSMRNIAHEPLELGDVAVSSLHDEIQTAQFDLNLNMTESGHGLSGGLIYKTDLFNAGTINRLIKNFVVLLKGAVESPDSTVYQVPLLTESERHQQLVTWNNTDCSYQEKCIHILFEEQVHKTPDAIAVIFENQFLTYDALNGRSNQLAYYLVEKGAGPETRAGLCVLRSLEMMTGVLGILKAGGAYVPIDPCNPIERTIHILHNSQIDIVLTQQNVLDNRVVNHLAHCVYLDKSWPDIEQRQLSNPAVSVFPANLAYVIYTSGSTGLPKGVAVTHSNVMNFVSYAMRHWTAQICGAVVSSTLAFDATVGTLYPGLLRGKPLYLIASGDEVDTLAALLSNTAVPLLFKLTPAHLAALIALLPGVIKPALSHVFVVAGEAFSKSIYNQWHQLFPQSCLVNEYGPTETTVGCSTFQADTQAPGVDISSLSSVPVGHAIENTKLYILDQYFDLLPVGSVGELYIGGKGVTRGYIERADLTAERFRPHPFSQEPGQRLYKSGDWVRYLDNSDME